MLDETEAIRKLKEADLDGLELLVREYQVRAMRTAYAIVRDRPLAEDVVQTAFLRLPRTIRYFTLGRPFRPWFMRVVANDAIAAVRRSRRLVSLEAAESEALDRLPNAAWPPEALAEQAETSAELWSLLDRLAPEQRAVVVLRFYAGLKNIEIAGELSIPPATVGWRLHRAVRRLRELLRRPKRPHDQGASTREKQETAP